MRDSSARLRSTSEGMGRLLLILLVGVGAYLLPPRGQPWRWPDAAAPFPVGLVNMRADDASVTSAADEIYANLSDAGVDTLYDDRDERGGAKFATMDVIGLPWQVIVGPKGLEKGVVELKNRATGEREELSMESALARLTG